MNSKIVQSIVVYLVSDFISVMLLLALNLLSSIFSIGSFDTPDPVAANVILVIMLTLVAVLTSKALLSVMAEFGFVLNQKKMMALVVGSWAILVVAAFGYFNFIAGQFVAVTDLDVRWMAVIGLPFVPSWLFAARGVPRVVTKAGSPHKLSGAELGIIAIGVLAIVAFGVVALALRAL